MNIEERPSGSPPTTHSVLRNYYIEKNFLGIDRDACMQALIFFQGDDLLNYVLHKGIIGQFRGGGGGGGHDQQICAICMTKVF